MEDLLWTQGQQNMGGLVGDLYAVEADQINLETALGFESDALKVTGDIVLNDHYKFARIYHTRGTGKLDDTVVGERDGRSVENMVEFNIPGNQTSVETFKYNYLNTPLVVICKDSEGNFRLMGLALINGIVTLDMPAYIESIAGTTGATTADKRGSTFQIKSEAPHPALFYTGTIDLVS